MLDQQDLQAISQLFDVKFQALDKKIDALEERMDKKMEALEARIDKKIDDRLQAFEKKIDERLQDFERRVHKDCIVLIEAEFHREFNLLAEGQRAIRDALIPVERIEALEDNDAVFRAEIRRINRELDALKKDVLELKQAN